MLSRAFAVLLLVFMSAFPLTTRAGGIALVLSAPGGVYGEFAAGFQQAIEGSPWQVRWIGGAESLDDAPRIDLVVTVGAEATRAVLRRGSSTPLVATLLPRQAYERALADTAGVRPRPASTAIFLDQPPGRQLAFIRQLLPDRHRIGLLAGPETHSMLPALRQAAQASGLGLEPEEVEGDANPVAALNHLLPRSDLLLALPDTVYKRDNIRAILLTTYRFQRPVVGFSQALVTAGALAAIYSTPAQIARQAGDLVRSLHTEPVSLPMPQTPAQFALSLNGNVAQALGLSLPDESSIRRALAADKEAR